MSTFCLKTYEKLLLSLRESGRSFRLFTEEPQNGLLLRLDVDFDLKWAASLAVENQKLGIRGTFFVHLTSPFYNALTPKSRQALKRITEAGQSIGLHYHHLGGELDVQQLKREYEILRTISPTAERVIAWHNPRGALEPLVAAARVAGFLSAYAEEFYGADKYISDSNCERLPEEILEFATKTTSPLVQVLLHPVNWVMGGKSMRDVLVRAFKVKFDQLIEGFETNRIWKSGLGQEILSQMSASPWYSEE